LFGRECLKLADAQVHLQQALKKSQSSNLPSLRRTIALNRIGAGLLDPAFDTIDLSLIEHEYKSITHSRMNIIGALVDSPVDIRCT
jgi:hypothetical protein